MDGAGHDLWTVTYICIKWSSIEGIASVMREVYLGVGVAGVRERGFGAGRGSRCHPRPTSWIIAKRRASTIAIAISSIY
jgi:hypothetical protein